MWAPAAKPAQRDGTSRPWASLGALKIVGIVLPVCFVVVLELIRWLVVERDMVEEGNPGELAGHVTLALCTVASVVVFASVMFFHIGRAQEQVIRQNRQLAAVNAVSTAIRDDLTVRQIVEHALDSVLASTGAVTASLTLAARPGRRGEERFGGSGPSSGGGVMDVALTAGTSSVGVMRLHWRAGQEQTDGLTAETLQTIGQQVAYAVQRAQLVADLTRGKQEGDALYEVLLRISNQRALPATLQTVARYARDHLRADHAVLFLADAAVRIVLVEGLPNGRPPRLDGLCVTPDGMGAGAGRPDRSEDVEASLCVPVGTPGSAYGDLLVVRAGEEPFTEKDRGFLVTLAELTTVALTAARMRENERQGAIIAERERIARELHDSLAQVLGVTHLRLQALRGMAEVGDDGRLDRELAELAGICHEGYRDVREAILGLGQSGRPDRYLLDSLSAYLEAFTRQNGIQTSLELEVDRDLVLLPRCEVQVIRIIQEALTNVRKHSGADRVVVRVWRSERSVEFEVRDDGAGFELQAVPFGRDGFGFGLSSINERVRLIGGSLAIDSAPGRGTSLLIEVPSALVQGSSTAEAAGSGGGIRGT
jgi:two-component system nitrate/nitrite sensor histidine kinase NarX